ncbi:sensor histidine kinase [Kineococcus sp. SYSU DK004]|uniref:sensor histidine kinase n=1 Tax=Kineococcus sp. SYSU DK004 TaxID=3383125 RepID=UPI003D7DCAA6
MTTAPDVAAGGAWRDLVGRVSPFAVPRRPGEWAQDAVVFALSLLLWSWFGSPLVSPQVPDWFWPVDRTLGLVACCLLWWTRRSPLACALLLVVPGSLAVTAGFPVLVGVSRLGLLGRPRTAVLVTALHVGCALPYHALVPVPGMSWLAWSVTIPLLYALALCVGLLGRARRQVVVGLTEAAARDRERYEERLAATRREERERIAREMHDVLAHRISLLSLHAGALEFRAWSPAPPAVQEVRAAATVIRENAHLAVEDLRELLCLLRADAEELGTGRPQPRLSDLAGLVRESRAAGQRVDVVVDVEGRRLGESVQRTVYRVVQECLTNARKHAPHTEVRVRVSGDDDRVHVTVDNPVPVGVTDADLPGRGNGLVGLAERVRLDGGTLRAGVDAGRFRVRADLPAGAR